MFSAPRGSRQPTVQPAGAGLGWLCTKVVPTSWPRLHVETSSALDQGNAISKRLAESRNTGRSQPSSPPTCPQIFSKTVLSDTGNLDQRNILRRNDACCRTSPWTHWVSVICNQPYSLALFPGRCHQAGLPLRVGQFWKYQCFLLGRAFPAQPYQRSSLLHTGQQQ